MARRARRGRGEGSFEELPSGKWRAVLSAGVDPVTGKRSKRTFTADTKKEVMDWLRDRQQEQSQGRLASAGKLRLADWLTQWLSSKELTVEHSTHDFYLDIVNTVLIPHLGQVQLRELSALHVERWHQQLRAQGVSVDRQRKGATTLRTALAAAVERNLIPTNVAKKVKKPKPEHREMAYWTAEEARRFLAATRGYRLEAYYILALDSGMRPSELLAARWTDLDWTARTLFVQRALEERKGEFRVKRPKSKAGVRHVQLTTHTMQSLREHRERMREEGQDVNRGTIFVTREGGFQSQPTIYRRSFLPMLKKAGLPHARPYTIRHTSATLLLAADVSILVVSKRLGHEDIATTLKHYGHAMPAMQQRAVAVMSQLLGSRCPTVAPELSEFEGVGLA